MYFEIFDKNRAFTRYVKASSKEAVLQHFYKVMQPKMDFVALLANGIILEKGEHSTTWFVSEIAVEELDESIL